MAASSDDDLVSIGTALHETEEDDATILTSRKQQHVSQQTVCDEKGRQRFHGAFTGGFSAGYFNTVGSKEGFEPKTFISTSSQRAEKQAAKPEDFMDDEDFKAHGIAPKLINVSENFDDQRKSGVKRPAQGGYTGLESLIVPTRNSIGVRLLLKMGVKEGQGIGARLSKKEKRSRKKKKTLIEEQEKVPSSTEGEKMIYGCSLPPPEYSLDHDSDDGDDHSAGFLFAPDDTTSFQFTVKDDVHGIGYRGLRTELVLTGGSNLIAETSDIVTDKGLLKMKGHAFGVGALEDDDDDIYAQVSMSNYDFTLDSKQPSEFTRHTSEGATKAGTPSVYKGVIAGFVKCSATLVVKKRYPPPILPRDFKPNRKSEPITDISQIESENQTWRSLNADNRWGIMADNNRSVFDFLKDEDRLKLKAIQNSSVTGSVMTPQGQNVAPSRPNMTPGNPNMVPLGHNLIPGSKMTPVGISMTPQTPNISPQTPNMTPQIPNMTPIPTMTSPSPNITPGGPNVTLGTNKFNMKWIGQGQTKLKPFDDNPEKQARFEKFLSNRSFGGGSISRGLTEWERRHEGEEFNRAAMMYSRAPSHMISSRFVSAGMSTGVLDTSSDTTSLPLPQTEQDAAAKEKMYGQKTRERHTWHPEKLLCKRFNIPDPYPDSDAVGIPGKKKGGYSVMDLLDSTTTSWQQSEINTDHTRNETEKTQEHADEKKQETTEKVAELLASVRKKVAQKSSTSRENKPENDSVVNDDRPSSSTLLSHLNEIPVPTESSSQKSETIPPVESKDTESTVNKQDLVTDETPTPTAVVSADVTSTRPPMDLFRAIFADSDSEESTEDEQEPETIPKTQEKSTIETEITAPKFPPNNESVTTALTWRRSVDNSQEQSDKNIPSPLAVSICTFGPALPPPQTIPLQISNPRSIHKKSSSKSNKLKKPKHHNDHHRHKDRKLSSKKSEKLKSNSIKKEKRHSQEKKRSRKESYSSSSTDNSNSSSDNNS